MKALLGRWRKLFCQTVELVPLPPPRSHRPCHGCSSGEARVCEDGGHTEDAGSSVFSRKSLTSPPTLFRCSHLTNPLRSLHRMDNETVDQGSKCSGNSYRSGSRGPLPATEPVLVASIRAPTPNACVHALPCSIHHDGPAAINTYFMPRKAAVVIPEVKTLKESSQSKEGIGEGVQ